MKRRIFVPLILLFLILFQCELFGNTVDADTNDLLPGFKQCVNNNTKPNMSELEFRLLSSICFLSYINESGQTSVAMSTDRVKGVPNFKRKTVYTKLSSSKILVSNYLHYTNPISSELTLISSKFISKFSQPYIAIQLPKEVTIDKKSVKSSISFFEAANGIKLIDVQEKTYPSYDWDWILENCENKVFEFTVDDSQTKRMLNVLNILHPPKDNYYWDIIKFNFPKEFNFPNENIFFDINILFNYSLDIKELPFDITYLISFGKLNLYPIEEKVYDNENKSSEKPVLDFIGEFGTSKTDIMGIKSDFMPAHIKWLCNCSDRDKTVSLNASIPEWDVNNFSFYNTSGQLELNNFEIKNKIGDNGATLTIPKPFEGEVKNINYPYDWYSMCNCIQMLITSDIAFGSHNKPGILKITAEDIENKEISAEATLALFEAANVIYPVLNVYNDNTNLKLSWYAPYAKKYILYYLPVGGKEIKQLDLDKMESAVLPFDQIPPLYIAIQACYEDDKCDLSNIEKTE
jgi:hypothetical protein